MRIAFYAPLKSPHHAVPSGDRRVARLLWQALAQAGHEVELASGFRSFEGQGDAVRQAALRAEGEAIADALIARWRGDDADARPALWFTYHLYYKAPDWIGPRVCEALGIPYVGAEASHAPKRAQGPWALAHAGAQHALERAALLLCPTRDDMACLQALVGARGTPVRQLAPFLDAAPFRAARTQRAQHRAAWAARLGLDAQRPWLVVVGMMRPGDKLASYEQLAQALALLRDRPWQLLVAGDGSARAQVLQALESAAPGRVFHAGQCEAAEMPGLLAAGDLCLWPAVNEAYGMALLEAQAAGLPVVAGRVRGVPDVICEGETGLLAPAGDIAGLAALARGLLDDSAQRARMGEAAARFVQTQRDIAIAAACLGGWLAPLVRPGALRAGAAA